MPCSAIYLSVVAMTALNISDKGRTSTNHWLAAFTVTPSAWAYACLRCWLSTNETRRKRRKTGARGAHACLQRLARRYSSDLPLSSRFYALSTTHHAPSHHFCIRYTRSMALSLHAHGKTFGRQHAPTHTGMLSLTRTLLCPHLFVHYLPNTSFY